MCLAQVRSARKTFQSHGCGAGLILAVFCYVGARTVRSTDAAAGALTATVRQLVQMQHAQQAASRHRSSVISGAGGIAQCEDTFDLRHLKYTTFDGTPMTIGLSASTGPFDRQKVTHTLDDAYTWSVPLDEFQEDIVDPQFEGLRMENVSAELYDLLCQDCTGGRIVLHTCC